MTDRRPTVPTPVYDGIDAHMRYATTLTEPARAGYLARYRDRITLFADPATVTAYGCPDLADHLTAYAHARWRDELAGDQAAVPGRDPELPVAVYDAIEAGMANAQALGFGEFLAYTGYYTSATLEPLMRAHNVPERYRAHLQGYADAALERARDAIRMPGR